MSGRPIKRTLRVSGDRDLVTSDVPHLIERYGAVAGDWESGTIAWVAKRHGTRTLILRTVSDVITETGNVTYGSARIWHEQTERIMQDHVRTLPKWIAKFRQTATTDSGS